MDFAKPTANAMDSMTMLEDLLRVEKYNECKVLMNTCSMSMHEEQNYDLCMCWFKKGLLKMIDKLLEVTNPHDMTLLELKTVIFDVVYRCCDVIYIQHQKFLHCKGIKQTPHNVNLMSVNDYRHLSKCVYNILTNTLKNCHDCEDYQIFEAFTTMVEKFCNERLYWRATTADHDDGFRIDTYHPIKVLFNFLHCDYKMFINTCIHDWTHNYNTNSKLRLQLKFSRKKQTIVIKNLIETILHELDNLTVCIDINDDCNNKLHHNTFNIMNRLLFLQLIIQEITDKQRVSLFIYSKFLNRVAATIDNILDFSNKPDTKISITTNHISQLYKMFSGFVKFVYQFCKVENYKQIIINNIVSTRIIDQLLKFANAIDTNNQPDTSVSNGNIDNNIINLLYLVSEMIDRYEPTLIRGIIYQPSLLQQTFHVLGSMFTKFNNNEYKNNNDVKVISFRDSYFSGTPLKIAQIAMIISTIWNNAESAGINKNHVLYEMYHSNIDFQQLDISKLLLSLSKYRLAHVFFFASQRSQQCLF